LEVVGHAAHGLTNREIGKKLFLSEETVKTHMRHILAKLRANNRTHAIAIVCMNWPEMLR
jgi:DNA-binding NarL/FixJ family response regulator